MERMKLKVTAASLRRRMRRKKLGVRDLAEMAGTSPSTVSRLASGVQSICRGDLGVRIEDALDEDRGNLFDKLATPQVNTPSEMSVADTNATDVGGVAADAPQIETRGAAA